MSFYLDDYPEEGQTDLCPHCGGRDFYSDPVSGTLTCSSCYTQSQSQHEEIDIDEGLGLAAMSGKRTKTVKVQGSNGGKGGKVARDLRDYDSSRKLPDVESCCLAFQWLLSDASKHVVKLSGMNEQHANKHPDHYQDEPSPSVLELTVKRIWFDYLNTWTQSAQYYSKKYPEMRVSFRDLFLSDTRRSVLVRHLSVTIGKRVEEEMIQKMQTKMQSKDGARIHDHMSTSSADDTGNAIIDRADSASKNRKLIISVPKLCSQVLNSHQTQDRHRLSNGCYEIDPFAAAIQIQPSLTLLLSIIQLALIHLKTGYAAYHLTSWVTNGSLPHALNGYALLPANLKDRVIMVKKFFVRSFVPPADTVDDLAFLLAASIEWLGDAVLDVKEPTIFGKHGSKRKRKSMGKPQKKQLVSVYNVPLLAARIVRDLGFRQKVIDNALALMGLRPNYSTKEKKPNSIAIISLRVASPSNLYTPLHVAAVIVVACKLCQGWENWIIEITHSSENSQCIPWNNAQLQLLGNGTALDKYIDFLQDTALNESNSNNDVSQYFQKVNGIMISQYANKHVPLKHNHPSVTPNTSIAGAPNPIEQPKGQSLSTYSANKKRHYMIHQKQKKGTEVTSESLHPSYRRLIEYICYTIEETKPAKLHNLVLDLEAELKRVKRSRTSSYI